MRNAANAHYTSATQISPHANAVTTGTNSIAIMYLRVSISVTSFRWSANAPLHGEYIAQAVPDPYGSLNILKFKV